MKTAALSLVALTCSCANAFTVSPAALRTQARGRSNTATSSTSLRMGWSLKEADFIPSEEWLGEYLGEQGLRYRMDKTEKEVAEEGDYTLLEKIFGQTSNNAERMKLKAEVLAKADIPTNPSLYKTWTEKYGYGRFFPVYVDKSGLSDDTPAPAKASKTVAPKKAPAKKAAAKAAPRAAAVKASSRPAAKSAPKAKAAPKKAAPKAAPKKAAPKVVAAAPKPQGNINNLPKAL
ncbi:unnamed protein product [Ectocarpus sp. 8 AP-2014]